MRAHLGFGFGLKTILLCRFVFRAVFVHHAEQFGGVRFVERLCELVDAWRDLQTLVQHTVLALETHILWPLDEAAEVALARDVPSDGESPLLRVEDGATLVSRRLTLLDYLLAFLGRHDEVFCDTDEHTGGRQGLGKRAVHSKWHLISS